MTTPIPLVYFDKGKAPRVVDPVPARQPKRATVTPEEQAEAERRQAAVQGWLHVGERLEKPRQTAKKATPTSRVPRPPAPLPPKPPPSPEARQAAAVAALREYLRLHDRGGHLAPWLRDGKRFRLVDARDQAYARGDAQTREVAGALLALTREQLEDVRRGAGVTADIGRVKPEGGT